MKNISPSETRNKLAKLLNDSGEYKKSPLSSQGAIFKVGDLERAAIHSEPNMREPRLFFIVPGSKKQINEMASKDNKPIMATIPRLKAIKRSFKLRKNRFLT